MRISGNRFDKRTGAPVAAGRYGDNGTLLGGPARGQTLIMGVRNGQKGMLISVSPCLMAVPNPTPERVAVVAEKLVQKYREAVAKGDKELARDLAKLALDLA
jgi:hypothetical protein